MTDVLRLKREFASQGVLIAFNGAFTHGLIEELGNAAKSYLEAERITPQTIIDVFAVYIEQTQNVRNYTKVHRLGEVGRESAIVTIGYADSEYTISSGNYVRSEDVPPLREHLDIILSLDRVGLRKAYKEQLRKEVPPGATGAGVGIIEMARRASEPIEYRFESDDADFAFFTLQVTVKGEAN